ncbi:MAG: hypothetical protein PSV13_02725 [Lacunisphaera sp.]|nr:hypothetical protein [Lacunisphaera sp.]
MKTIVVFLALISSCIAQMRIEDWEPDFVWAALKTKPEENQGSASLTTLPRAYHATQLRKKPAGPWKAFVETTGLQIKAELVGAGWQVREVGSPPPAEQGRVSSFVFEAKKESRGLRLYISLIPVDDRSFYASYVQAAL